VPCLRGKPGEEEDVHVCFQASGGREFILAGGEFDAFVQHGKCLRGLIPIGRVLISLIKINFQKKN
jgi:hypothetical protein